MGVQGPVHAEWSHNLHDSELVGVCDIDGSKVKAMVAKYKCKGYTDYHEMLENKDIDAIIIVTPGELHAQMAIDAAKAGKHVAVEKPLCIELKEADEMIRAVKKAGVRDAYFENLCYAPTYATAKQVMDDGGIGDVFFIRCGESGGLGIDTYKAMFEKARKEGKKPSRGEYGILHGGGCHPIMCVRYLYDRQPAVRVYAETRSYARGEPMNEDVALVTITYKGGQIAWIDACSYALGTFDDRCEIYGTKGSILMDLYGVHMTTGIKVYSQPGFNPTIGSSRYPRGKGYFGTQTNWSHPMTDEERSLGYYHEQEAFLKSILAEERPSVNFDDGKATLEVIFAAYKSRDTGNSVTLPLTY